MGAQTQTTRWTQNGSLAGLIATAVLWAMPSPGLAQEDEILARGRIWQLTYYLESIQEK